MGEEAVQVEEDKVVLVTLKQENLGLLRNLNAVLFPVNYQQKYYAHALSAGDFSKLAYVGESCVGSVTCRIETFFGGKRVYILTLGVLAPYRRLGIGSKLMKHVMELCEQEKDIIEIYLHVQVNNEEALQFYKKFNFEVRDMIQNYYKRIDPPHCYLLARTLSRSVVSQSSENSEVPM